MRILLIEDHRLVRESLSAVLKRHYTAWEFGEAGSSLEAKQALQTPWDVVLLDLLLPDGSGLDLLSHIKSCLPKTRVIILTAACEEDYGIAALSAGADGFVSKRVSHAELLEAIELALAGKRYFPQTIAERILALHSNSGQNAELLCGRELDVLHFVGEGLSGAQIARTLDISLRTVETCRTRIGRKLGISGNAALVRFAVAHDLRHNSSTAGVNVPVAASAPAPVTQPDRDPGEIQQTWRSSLVRRLQESYGLPEEVAQQKVDAWLSTASLPRVETMPAAAEPRP